MRDEDRFTGTEGAEESDRVAYRSAREDLARTVETPILSDAELLRLYDEQRGAA